MGAWQPKRLRFRTTARGRTGAPVAPRIFIGTPTKRRSEEHTSELQSLRHLVCRLLLEKKRGERVHWAHALCLQASIGVYSLLVGLAAGAGLRAFFLLMSRPRGFPLFPCPPLFR